MVNNTPQHLFLDWIAFPAELNSAGFDAAKLAAKLAETADTVIAEVFNVREGERFLIVTNPHRDTALISMALYEAAKRAGGLPSLVFQPERTLLDFADESVIGALEKQPDLFASISMNKLGKDKKALASPYHDSVGNRFDHVFDYNLYGRKTMRAIWSPGITLDMFLRTAPIDYVLLRKRCQRLIEKLKGASSVHVTAPGGTDITVSVKGRDAFGDDGDCHNPATGGNIPAGEVYISPALGESEGVIVFDGSISLRDGDIIINEPIRAVIERGFVTSISGGTEAALLEESITAGETSALDFEKRGMLPEGQGKLYSRNARNLGELGIGLNPGAGITGYMLEDEKAFHTCHFAIGSNYDDDAPSMIHLDGVVKEPTITVLYADGSRFVVEKDGELAGELL
jgi:leucyl aminopeptidase (aminopeptidase T)